MRKKKWSLLVVGLVSLMLSGCTQENVANEIAEPVEVEVEAETDPASEQVVEEVIELPLAIEFGDKSFNEMIEFIDIHKQEATADEKDEMVLKYDEQLREHYKLLSTKFNDTLYFNAINKTKDEKYLLHLDEIANGKIKAEVEILLEAGYGFQMLEGSYYLVIDYVKFNKMFADIQSENLSLYYGLRSDEAEMPVTVEEYLNIGFDEVYKRVATLESFISNNPNFKFREDAKNWLNWYISSLLSVDIFSGAVDYETGFVSEKLKLIYDDIIASDLIIAKEAVSEMQAIIKNYDCIIKPDNQEAVDAVYAVRNKYYNEVPSLIDTYYPVK